MGNETSTFECRRSDQRWVRRGASIGLACCSVLAGCAQSHVTTRAPLAASSLPAGDMMQSDASRLKSGVTFATVEPAARPRTLDAASPRDVQRAERRRLMQQRAQERLRSELHARDHDSRLYGAGN